MQTIAAATAHATAAPSTSWSELKMETCDKDNTAQSFEIDSATGTGRIRDSETGRCVTMKTCTLGSGIQKSIEVVCSCIFWVSVSGSLFCYQKF